jgi:hypothetical protein
MQSIRPVETHVCPLCGQPNQCAMEAERATGVKQPPCWCSQLKFDTKLLERIPEQVRGKACVCAACAQADGSQNQLDEPPGADPHAGGVGGDG